LHRELNLRGEWSATPVEGHRQVQPSVGKELPEREIVLHAHLELDARMVPREAGEGIGEQALGDVLGHAEPEQGLGLLGLQALQQLVIER